MVESCLFYYITNRRAFAGDEVTRRRLLLEKISEAARAGVDYIQLREKDLSARALESLAREAVTILNQLRTENRELRTALLINSRTDIALATEADGVHLRSNDISPQEVRAIWKESKTECGRGRLARALSPGAPVIGVSCHSPAEVVEAEAQGASFVVFGPVFEKKDVSPAGLALLRKTCKAKIPLLALGGVTLENARSCLEAGAAGIAAIRLFQENDIANLVRVLRSKP
jgi:thiamine-phosphate pyrophosphorylase